MGYLYVLLASTLFGLSPTLSALLQRSGWSNGAVLLNNEVFGGLYLLFLTRSKGLGLRIKKREFAVAAGLGGISFWGTNILLQKSYILLPSPGIATVLHFIYPIFVMVIMEFLFKERLTPPKLLCAVISLWGIVLIADISRMPSQSTGLLTGVLLATASGAAYAVYIVSNSKSPARGIHPLILIFYVLMGGAAANSLYLLVVQDFSLNLAGKNCIYAAALPLCSFLALVTIAEGIRKIGPTRAAIINMLEPVVSMLVSAAAFPDEVLTVRMFCGGGLILLGTGALAMLNHSGGLDREDV